MINETILAIIIAFAVSAILCPIVIPFLHKLKFGQQVREDGPQAHLKKQGTPTMGGPGIPDCCSDHIPVIYSRLSAHHSGTVHDRGLWRYRLSG